MKLNQKGSTALPFALLISAILAGAAYYNSRYSNDSIDAVSSNINKSRVGDSLSLHLNEKMRDLKSEIAYILNDSSLSATAGLQDTLTVNLSSNLDFKCQTDANYSNPNNHVVKFLKNDQEIIFICRDEKRNNQLGFIVEAHLIKAGKKLKIIKKGFVASRIPIGYITLIRNNPLRTNEFLTPFITNQKLQKNMPVYLHDKIKTDSKSFVHITMLDDTILNLSPNTEFIIEEFEFREKFAKTERNGIYNLINGFIRANFNKHSQNQLIIKTKTAAMGIRGTTLTIATGEISSEPYTTINLLEGKIELLDKKGNSLNPPKFMNADNAPLGVKGSSPNYSDVLVSTSSEKTLFIKSAELSQEDVKKIETHFSDENIMSENKANETLFRNSEQLTYLNHNSLDEKFNITSGATSHQMVDQVKISKDDDFEIKHEGDYAEERAREREQIKREQEEKKRREQERAKKKKKRKCGLFCKTAKAFGF